MNAALFGPLVLEFELTVFMSLWLVSVADTDDDEEICEEEEKKGRWEDWEVNGFGSKIGEDLGMLVVVALGLRAEVGSEVVDRPSEFFGGNDDMAGDKDGGNGGKIDSLVAGEAVGAGLELGTMDDGPLVDWGVAGDTDVYCTVVVPVPARK